MFPKLPIDCTPQFLDPKPPFPYSVGKRLRLRPHMPPPPVQSWLDEAELKYEDYREREYVDPARRCLLHSPSAGEFLPGIAELEIVGHVRAGDGHSGQLIIVRVLTSTLDLPTDIDLLVKLYDPLYFDHFQYDADPFRYVDSAYIQESGVYRRIADVHGGSFIPKYYGSFSLSLPVRDVRLILMENVPGTSMDNLNPSDFSQPERQAIMKAIIDYNTELYTNNIKHKDMYPCNMIVLPKPLDQARKVVVVDFGQSWTFRTRFPELEAEFLPGVPISPLLRWTKPDEDFKEWVDWDWKPWVEREYEHTRGSITEEMRSKWGPMPDESDGSRHPGEWPVDESSITLDTAEIRIWESTPGGSNDFSPALDTAEASSGKWSPDRNRPIDSTPALDKPDGNRSIYSSPASDTTG